jgi:hypothetical protein
MQYNRRTPQQGGPRPVRRSLRLAGSNRRSERSDVRRQPGQGRGVRDPLAVTISRLRGWGGRADEVTGREIRRDLGVVAALGLTNPSRALRGMVCILIGDVEHHPHTITPPIRRFCRTFRTKHWKSTSFPK